jgi:IPT/TIG domain
MNPLADFKAGLRDLVREARAAGIPALDISLAVQGAADATAAPIPPNSEPIVPGEGGGPPPIPTQPPPIGAPGTVVACSPTSAAIGAGDLLLTVNGSGFDEDSKIVFNGGEEPTTLVSSRKLTTIVKPSTATTPGIYPVEVTGCEGSATFEFTEPEGRSRKAA